MKEALQSSDTAYTDSLFKQAFDLSLHMTMILDAGKRAFVEANAAALKWLGYEKETLLQMPPDAISEDLPMLFTAVHQHNTGKPFSRCLYMKWHHQNGTQTATEATVSAIEHPHTTYLLITSTGQSLLPQKREEALFQASLFSSINGAIVATDQHFNVTNCNRFAEEMFGWDESEVMGRSTRTLADTLYPSVCFEEIREELFTKGKWKGEVITHRKNGEAFPAYLTVGTVTNAAGTITGTITIIHDLTEQKKPVQEMREMNATLQQQVQQKTEEINEVFERVSDAVVAIDKDWRYTYVNSKAATLLQHQPEALLGKNVWEIFSDDGAIPFRIAYEKALAQQQYLHFEHYYAPLNVYMENHIYPSPNGLSVFIKEVTAKKLAEEALAASERRFRTLVEQGSEGIMILDAEATPTYVSAGVEKKIGYTETEVLGFTATSNVHPDDIAHTQAKFEESLRQPGVPIRHIVYRIRHKKGHWMWMQSTLTNYLHNPDINGVINNFSDITQIKRSEETTAFQAYLLNTIGQAIVATDEHGTISFWNKAAEEIYGWRKEDAVGQKVYDFAPPPRSRQAMAHALQQLEQGHNVHSEWTLQRKDGTTFPALITDSPILDKAGKLSGIVSIITNIAQQKKTEQELALLLNNTEQSFIFLNSNLRIVYFNQQFQTYYQTIFKNVVQKDTSIFEYVAPDRLAQQKKLFRNVLAGLKAEYEREYTDAMGSRKIFLFKFFPAKDEQQTIIGVFITVTDITARRKAEEDKQEEQRNKEALINTTDDMIWSVDNHYRLVAGNHTFYNAMKIYTGEDLQPGDNLLMEKSYAHEWLQFWKSLYNRALQGESFREEMISPSSINEGKRWEEIMFKPVWNGKTIVGVACYSRNVTERKLIEEKIRKTLVQQQLYSAIVQSSDDGIISQSPEGIITSWNRGAQQIFGYEAPEMEGQLIEKLIPSDKQNEAKNLMQTLQLKGFVRNFETAWLTKAGRRINLSLTASPIVDEKGILTGASLIARDITDIKTIENKVKKSEQRFRTLFEQNLAGFYEISADGRILNCNMAFAQMLKYNSPAELRNKEIISIYFSDFDLKTFFEELAQKQQIQNHEGVMKCKDETPLYFIENITMRFDEAENNTVYDGIILDITERTRALQAVRISNERYDLAAKATSDVIWDWNVQTNEVIRSAESMKKVFGYGKNELASSITFWLSKVHPDDLKKVQQLFSKKFSDPDEQFIDCEYRFLKADGTYAHAYDKGFIIRDSEGKPVRMIGAVQDISRLKESELIVKQRAEELEASNRELEQFAYVASHDLQEPLRMVTNFLTQLQKNYEAMLDERAKKYIHFAVDGAVRMRQIILDLLEYSRVGRTGDQKEEVNLNHIVKEIEILFQRKIKEKKAILTFDTLPSLVAHKPPLRQLFQNIISNALTYTNPAAQPRVHVWAEDKNSYWQFAVSDNGIGIEPDYFERIFVIFQRLHTRESYAGTGMGLAIAKKIVENMGGRIWVTSEEGAGSTFYFTLPK